MVARNLCVLLSAPRKAPTMQPSHVAIGYCDVPDVMYDHVCDATAVSCVRLLSGWCQGGVSCDG